MTLHTGEMKGRPAVARCYDINMKVCINQFFQYGIMTVRRGQHYCAKPNASMGIVINQPINIHPRQKTLGFDMTDVVPQPH